MSFEDYASKLLNAASKFEKLVKSATEESLNNFLRFAQNMSGYEKARHEGDVFRAELAEKADDIAQQYYKDYKKQVPNGSLTLRDIEEAVFSQDFGFINNIWNKETAEQNQIGSTTGLGMSVRAPKPGAAYVKPDVREQKPMAYESQNEPPSGFSPATRMALDKDDDILKLQKRINTYRQGPGLRPIKEDGRLGPETLGALHLLGNIGKYMDEEGSVKNEPGAKYLSQLQTLEKVTPQDVIKNKKQLTEKLRILEPAQMAWIKSKTTAPETPTQTKPSTKYVMEKEAADKKWIQKAVKNPGRFEGWSLGKMKSRYNALNKKEDKTKSETSEMRALALGIRMKGGDVPGGKKKKGL
jgi:hypothetical protein